MDRMKWLYDHICMPLMQINNNVYTFFSGILISLSTNIFTTLCFEKFDFIKQWHVYCATVLFAISGAMSIYIATKMTGFQNYIISKQIIDPVEKKEIIKDVTMKQRGIWLAAFLILLSTTIVAVALLIINYIVIGR